MNKTSFYTHNINGNITKRENYIDTLRALGLILLMLAHVHPNIIIQQLRCFDVPLMLLISGYVANYNQQEGILRFYFKRIKRLLVPVYIFLSIIFIFWFCAGSFNIVTLPDNFCLILRNSFLLLNENSIGFVWIIRVFILMMFLTPLLHRINLSTTKNIIAIISCLVILNVLCSHLYNNTNPTSFIGFVNKEILTYSSGYFILFTAGRCLKMSNCKQFWTLILLGISLLSVCLLYIYLSNSSYIITQYKYPPHLYFLTYGMILSIILFSLFRKYIPRNINENKVIEFIGSNTIWIYLWHIPLQKIINALDIHWIVKWPMLVISSAIIFYLQYILVNKFAPSKIKKYLIG